MVHCFKFVEWFLANYDELWQCEEDDTYYQNKIIWMASDAIKIE